MLPLCLLLGGCTDHSPAQDLRFALNVQDDLVLKRATVKYRRLGRLRTVELLDDGSARGDVRLDNIYVAHDIGPYARYINLRLLVEPLGGATTLVFEGLLRTTDRRRNQFVWQLVRQGMELRALPSRGIYPVRANAFMAKFPTLVMFSWGAMVVLLVGVILRFGRRRRPPNERREGGG